MGRFSAALCAHGTITSKMLAGGAITILSGFASAVLCPRIYVVKDRIAMSDLGSCPGVMSAEVEVIKAQLRRKLCEILLGDARSRIPTPSRFPAKMSSISSQPNHIMIPPAARVRPIVTISNRWQAHFDSRSGQRPGGSSARIVVSGGSWHRVRVDVDLGIRYVSTAADVTRICRHEITRACASNCGNSGNRFSLGERSCKGGFDAGAIEICPNLRAARLFRGQRFSTPWTPGQQRLLKHRRRRSHRRRSCKLIVNEHCPTTRSQS